MEHSVLYYGDNLEILRRHVKDQTVDLVYLDPPFNSNRDYNVLFAEQDGTRSPAQVKAFSDSWRWDSAASTAFNDTIENGGRAAEALAAFRALVGESDMLAYLSMMSPRLVELRRVLRSTGSIYLHCDPTASHYLKILMDAVFGPQNFRTEIVWKRQSAHNDTRQGRRQHGRVHDTILFYTMSSNWTWNPVFTPYNEAQLESGYRWVEGPDGETRHLKAGEEPPAGWRRFSLGDLTGPGGEARGSPVYELMGVTRAWRFSREKMEQMVRDGRVVQTATGNVPMQKRYLEEMPGVALQDLWTDLPLLGAQAAERLGYPTQKPEALLDRIIRSSSNEGDTVLDPFCGCGTTIAVAQRLGRRWIGIDLTHLAISLIRSRLADAYGDKTSYTVSGEPRDVGGAEALARMDRYQFEWWALGRVKARPVAEERKKGADSGIDGKLFFRERENGPVKVMVIQVKSGSLTLSQVRDFGRVIEREKAPIGVLVTLEPPTREMRAESASMGSYRPEYHLSDDDKFDRFQILTVEDLFNGKQPQYPPFRNVTFKPAPEARPSKQKRVRTHRLSARSETGSVAPPTVDSFGIGAKASGTDEANQ